MYRLYTPTCYYMFFFFFTPRCANVWCFLWAYSAWNKLFYSILSKRVCEWNIWFSPLSTPSTNGVWTSLQSTVLGPLFFHLPWVHVTFDLSHLYSITLPTCTLVLHFEVMPMVKDFFLLSRPTNPLIWTDANLLVENYRTDIFNIRDQCRLISLERNMMVIFTQIMAKCKCYVILLISKVRRRKHTKQVRRLCPGLINMYRC